MLLSEKLVAPCGMNCAVCSKYLSHAHKLNRSQCPGCRSRNKKCAYLFDKCSGMNHGLKINAAAQFCSECGQYPCKQIHRMDARYRQHYKMSVTENLEYIHQNGPGEFIRDQYRRYRCPRCGGWISIHNRKCFKCDTITKLVEKQRDE